MRTASLTYAMTKFSTFALFGLFGVGLCVAVRMLVKWSGLQDDEDGKNPVDVGTPCFVTKLIKIPAESVGRVVGRYGRNLRRIEKQTKAFIQLMRDNKYGDGCSMFGYQNEEDWSVSCCGNNAHGPTSEFRCIEIRAETPERIRLACLAIYGHVAEARVHEITKCMFIPNNLMEPVVGNNWNDIKNLQARYKVRIEISQMFEGGDRMVSITGHKNNVELAEAQVAWMTSRDSCHDGADEFDTSLEETIRKLEQMKMQLESDEKAYGDPLSESCATDIHE